MRNFGFRISDFGFESHVAMQSGHDIALSIHNPQSTIRNRHSRPGFNLTELMFSILILGLGLIAVAGLFPTAGTMQKATADQVVAQQVALSARAAFLARADTGEISITNGWLKPMDFAGGGIQRSNDFEARWPIADRTSATGDFYWVPLFRKDPAFAAANQGWTTYILVLRTLGDTAPQNTPNDANVVRAGRAMAGDYVFDGRPDATLGGAPRVAQLTADTPDGQDETRWHGQLLGTISPTKQFLVFGFEPAP